MTLPLTDHFNGKTFFQNHHDNAVRHRDLWRWQLTARPKPWPARVPLPVHPAPPTPRGLDLVLTWVGHATFLIQTTQGNLLTDPVFSRRASPLRWAGPARAQPPGIAFEALPPIHGVLLSHDHYDHCDLGTLRRLAAIHHPVFIAPLRHRDLLVAARAARIVELDWWASYQLGADMQVTLTPSKHWSNRFGTPRNHRLWGGFFITLVRHAGAAAPTPATNIKSAPDYPARRIWFAGDTGYDPAMFREIKERCGAPDIALVPIGAYEPRWFMAPMHVNPAEAVQLHRDVGARMSVAMHWGTFRLTDEGRDDPVLALTEARKRAGITPDEFRVIAPGETVVVPDNGNRSEPNPNPGSNRMST